MFSKWLLLCLLCLFTRTVLSAKCYSPDNQEGRCVSLLSCPEMLKEFVNPNPKHLDYLKRFICGNNEDGMKVCCDVRVNYDNIPIKDWVPEKNDNLYYGDAINCDPETYFSEYEFVPPSVPEIRAKNHSSNQEFTKCLGSLITSRYILTAAECIPQGRETDEFQIVGVQFQVGNKTNSRFQIFGVEKEVPHPFYDKVTGVNNIALLRLNYTFFENEEIRQACLYRLGNPLNPGVPTATFISRHDSNMKGTLTKLVSSQECKYSLTRKDKHDNTTTYDICTTGIKHSTSTSLASYVGGPVFVVLNTSVLQSTSDNFDVTSYQNFIKLEKEEESDNTDSKDADGDEDEEEEDDSYPLFNLYLVGVSSSRTMYVGNIHSVYTNVSAYFEWISESIRPLSNEHCTSPSSNTGNCVSLIYCPALMKAFSNPKKGAEEYLRKFICTKREPFYAFGIFVCCSPTFNTTFFENEYHSPNSYEYLKFDFFDLKRCGMQHRDDYISFDQNITIDEFPWAVSILQKTNRQNPHYSSSSGSLINARYVITRIHYEEPKNLLLRLGDFNRVNHTDCVEEPDIGAIDCSDYQDFNIEEIINHPFHDYHHEVNNIALMRLKGNVLYTDFIRPICLPMPGTSTASLGDTLYLSSWGFTPMRYHTVLKKKILNQLTANTECTKRFIRSYKSVFLGELKKCTLYSQTNATLACENDHGGSLIFHNNYQWHIEGILIDPGKDDCNIGDALVYTAVSKYFNWIVDNMRPW